jgi:hypothetical protein
MVAHQKSSPGRKISSKLLALLAGLDEMVPDFDWKVLGVSADGLYNLLGFKSFLTYQEFMIACGFVGRSYRGNNKPYFLANRFQEEASQKFRPLTKGKQKHWFLPSRERIDWTNAVQSWPIIDRRRIKRNREDGNQCHKRKSEVA